MRCQRDAAIDAKHKDLTRKVAFKANGVLLNYDTAFVEAVAAMLEEGFHHSCLVKLEDYTERSFIFRFAVRSARLLAPIL